MSREHGILFSAPMVRAILDGTKTQTRRAVKPQPPGDESPLAVEWFTPAVIRANGEMEPAEKDVFGAYAEEWSRACPYGAPGDRLWVRETWRPCMEAWATYVEYAAGGDPQQVNRDAYTGLKKLALRFPGGRKDVHSEAWHPSIRMPRWASRITLEITEVRVQRLHDITDADIRAEGVTAEAVRALVGRDYITEQVNTVWIADLLPRDLWRIGWTAINGEESWDATPWLWCLTFKRVQP